MPTSFRDWRWSPRAHVSGKPRHRPCPFVRLRHVQQSFCFNSEYKQHVVNHSFVQSNTLDKPSCTFRKEPSASLGNLHECGHGGWWERQHPSNRTAGLPSSVSCSRVTNHISIEIQRITHHCPVILKPTLVLPTQPGTEIVLPF